MVPSKIDCIDLKLSIMLGELSVLVRNALHDLCCGGYSVGVLNSCFDDLYYSWKLFLHCHSVLQDVW
jgi:hypothetical protein